MEWQRRFPRPVGHGVFLTDRADWATTVEFDTSEVQSDETGVGRFEEETAPALDPAEERDLDQLMEYYDGVWREDACRVRGAEWEAPTRCALSRRCRALGPSLAPV